MRRLSTATAGLTALVVLFGAVLGVSMSGSSVIVAVNALLLKRLRLPQVTESAARTSQAAPAPAARATH